MNYKKKIIILSIFLIIIIQILLLINNRQKTSFRYFIWNIENVSIGRLISISFISGVLMSALLNKNQNKNVTSQSNEEDDNANNENDYSINSEENNESYEIPPERDLRETQPTISVNYRVIKNNREKELKDKNKISKESKYQDDWKNNDTEW